MKATITTELEELERKLAEEQPLEAEETSSQVIDDFGPEPEPATEPAIYLTYDDAVILFAAAKDQTYVMRRTIEDIKADDYSQGDALIGIGLGELHDHIRDILRANQGQMIAAYREKRGY